MKKLCMFFAMAALLATTGCGWTKKSLGLAQTGPDETLVHTNKPLILPPEYEVRPSKALIKNQDEDEIDAEDDVSAN